jgi:sporulation protein YlmC with PRC-barrel domain
MNEYELKFGTSVTTTGGKCGKLAAVAVDTAKLHVTHLIAEEGLLLKKARAFPFTLVRRAGDTIDLAISSGAVEDYPQYREETIDVPAESNLGGGATYAGGGYHVPTAPPMARQKVRYGIPEERAVLERGATVTASDGRAGKLDHLMVDPETGAITHLVLQQGTLFPSRRVMPAGMIESVSHSGVFLHATHDELETLPEYDAEAVTGDEPAPEPYDELAPGADPAEPTAVRRDRAGDDLGTRVARALFEDPRTADSVIEVIDEHGIITLSGTVPNAQTGAAAADIAAAQPGVISVTNTLRVA